MTDLQLDYLKKKTNLNSKSINVIVSLLDSGNTIPFIARYRKEAHGNLDEVQILAIKNAYLEFSRISDRQDYILNVIEKEGSLTQALKKRIQNTYDLNRLEDFYLPYKKKRKSKASVAISYGLDKLLKDIVDIDKKITSRDIKEFLRINRIKIDEEEALTLMTALYASKINEDPEIRNWVRNQFEKHGKFSAQVKKGKEKEGELYAGYFDYIQSWKTLLSYRVLAMLRAENKGILRIKLRPEKQKTIEALTDYISEKTKLNKFAKEAIAYAYKKHLEPSIEKEFISQIREKSQYESADTFAQNLKTLLLSPPISSQPLIAIDPGLRTGHKLVALSAQGELLDYENVRYDSQESATKMKNTISNLIKKYDIKSIAIGNGTGGREAYNWLSENFDLDLYIVDESGASVYSASEIAREEFPDLDITFRGSVSIGRRLQNALAELIKIDPKSLGIGQYHHDIPVRVLSDRIDEVAQITVNKVGVDLNTASHPLLSYVSGIGPSLAENIIEYRKEHFPFTSRKELLKIHGLGPRSYEQAAGFLRIPGAKNKLDSTNIHPEAYQKVEEIAQSFNWTVKQLFDNINNIDFSEVLEFSDETFGPEYLKDIYEELKTPGRDFRNEAQPVQFTDSVKTIEDLENGLRLNGFVTNITDFGAFIDIGIKENGLVHKSEISEKYIETPFDVLDLMQHVEVRVLDVDKDRKRIKLSMK